MYYELRTYTAAPGREAQVVTNLRHFTQTLFKECGFDPVAFFLETEEGGRAAVVYLLRWSGHDERSQKWAMLRSHPQWLEFLAQQADDPDIVHVNSQWLKPLDGFGVTASASALLA